MGAGMVSAQHPSCHANRSTSAVLSRHASLKNVTVSMLSKPRLHDGPSYTVTGYGAYEYGHPPQLL